MVSRKKGEKGGWKPETGKTFSRKGAKGAKMKNNIKEDYD